MPSASLPLLQFEPSVEWMSDRERVDFYRTTLVSGSVRRSEFHDVPYATAAGMLDTINRFVNDVPEWAGSLHLGRTWYQPLTSEERAEVEGYITANTDPPVPLEVNANNRALLPDGGSVWFDASTGQYFYSSNRHQFRTSLGTIGTIGGPSFLVDESLRNINPPVLTSTPEPVSYADIPTTTTASSGHLISTNDVFNQAMRFITYP